MNVHRVHDRGYIWNDLCRGQVACPRYYDGNSCAEYSRFYEGLRLSRFLPAILKDF